MTVMTTGTDRKIKEISYAWEGKDRCGKIIKGEIRAASTEIVTSMLRRQGIRTTHIRKIRPNGSITDKDITLFTRQLAALMKSGVPLLQAFDIVAKGHSNPAMGKLLLNIRIDIETGSSLANAFRKYPFHFDALYCNLVDAGETGGILDDLLDRLATHKEKIQTIKNKIKSALLYPVSIIVVALAVTAMIMIFVIPAFKELFAGFGATLPTSTLMVITVSDFFVAYWWVVFGVLGSSLYIFLHVWKRSMIMQQTMDRLMLKLPILGNVIRKAIITRWARTLSTMFAAGVPLVEALNSVAGAAGNHVYFRATKKIQLEVSTGNSLTASMANTDVFPNMVLQMVAIGEESGTLDSMLNKVADFLETEVDDATTALSSLMEPFIMVVLGILIGGLVIAMYLPIFNMGQIIG